MTNNGDWAAFVALMWPAWYWDTEIVAEGEGCFWHKDTVYYPHTGILRVGAGKEQHVGTWREWLAAGTSPVPW